MPGAGVYCKVEQVAHERSYLFFVCEAVVSGLCTCVGTALVRHPDGFAVVVERPLPPRDVAPYGGAGCVGIVQTVCQSTLSHSWWDVRSLTMEAHIRTIKVLHVIGVS